MAKKIFSYVKTIGDITIILTAIAVGMLILITIGCVAIIGV